MKLRGKYPRKIKKDLKNEEPVVVTPARRRRWDRIYRWAWREVRRLAEGM